MAEVIPFPRGNSLVGQRLARFLSNDVDPAQLEQELGTPDQWCDTAILLLKAATCALNMPTVPVPISALHIVLGYVEHLEGRLGISPPPAAA